MEARSTHDQRVSRSNPANSKSLACDLEHIHRIPSTKLCACVRACVRACVCVCVCVCVIFILKVVFRKLRFTKYMGGIMLKEALLFLLFFVFLDYVKYKILSAVAVFTAEEQEK